MHNALAVGKINHKMYVNYNKPYYRICNLSQYIQTIKYYNQTI